MVKADLSIPWNKLRKLRRWLIKWKIKFPGEGMDREEAKSLPGEIKVSAKSLFLQFHVKNPVTGKLGTEYRLTPSISTNLENICVRYLQDLDRCKKLNWHGVIPQEEAWVKVGGDKVGDFMKTCLEVCNVDHPNSINNTIIINMYKGIDSYYNLETATKALTVEIKNLEGSTWRDFNVCNGRLRISNQTIWTKRTQWKVLLSLVPNNQRHLFSGS
ncbi:uncharacterized protein LOC144440135 [Glandiceps talaboti]